VNELYPIGDVARRTGLNVSAIRFYADEGIVPPSGLTEGGFRLYDVTAIARLELVRTLRDLGVARNRPSGRSPIEPVSPTSARFAVQCAVARHGSVGVAQALPAT